MRNGERRRGGGGAGINMPTEIFQRLCQRTTSKKKQGQSRCCSHVVQHLWRGRQGKGMLRKKVKYGSKGGGGGDCQKPEVTVTGFQQTTAERATHHGKRRLPEITAELKDWAHVLLLGAQYLGSITPMIPNCSTAAAHCSHRGWVKCRGLISHPLRGANQQDFEL